ncbi:MAG: ribose-phosphate pyrophosphokinase [Lentisphaeraceae bacterium]|nr:ribose-phosphate pyrophosphokinase [Lentisphaeraceae bacterium]
MRTPVVIGNTSDSPFAIDIAHYFGQTVDISDIIALKDFQNTEFCPRFISDEDDLDKVGNYLREKIVIVASTSCKETRNATSMRNIIIGRAAKDNGAEEVVLVEPDLFYSCQDRGPREEHTFFKETRTVKDRKKFDGQAFTALLNAQLLKFSGFDRVFTVHNHSFSTQKLFSEEFNGKFHNLVPADLFAHYLVNSDIVDPNNIVLCAPDKGAAAFVDLVKEELHITNPRILRMDKSRSGERSISMEPSHASEISIEDVKGRDVVVFDDMVRTGTTIVECCKQIKEYGARRIIFCVTHFHSSPESREKLSTPYVDEIVTTNTIPAILNRDTQGRLRKKITVLKLEKWIAAHIQKVLDIEQVVADDVDPYQVDMSSKNPRWREEMGRAWSKNYNS